MKVEINLRLDVKGGGGTIAAGNERCRDVLDTLQYYLSTPVTAKRFDGSNGLWIGFDYRGDLRNLHAILTVICVKAVQECCAVYYPEIGAGELIGPWAYAWGDFNINDFVTGEELP